MCGLDGLQASALDSLEFRLGISNLVNRDYDAIVTLKSARSGCGAKIFHGQGKIASHLGMMNQTVELSERTGPIKN